MMGRIDRPTIDRVRDAADIVALVGEAVTLKRSGRSFKGLCPFHQEKTPSFHVFPDSGRYKCFGCGEGGNAIDWVMNRDGVEFVESIEILADRNGIAIERESDDRPQEDSFGKNDLFRVNLWAAQVFRRGLQSPGGEACRAYLEKRGISPEDQQQWGIGYASAGWEELMRLAQKQQIPELLLEEAGLAIARDGRHGHYDRFRDRLIFPIRDASDRVIGFGGRSLDGSEPKYLNSPETRVFSKGRALYGAGLLRGLEFGQPVHVMEGYTDVLMAARFGCRAPVATLGTALTEAHAKMLSRFTDRVTLVYDGDAAGRRAAERGAEIFAAVDLDLRIALLPGGQDPCDFFLEQGEAGLGVLDARTKDFFEFVVDEVRSRHDTEALHGRVQAADELLALVRGIRNPVKQGLAVDRVAEALSLPRPDLEGRLKALGPQRTRREVVAKPAVSEPVAKLSPARRRAESQVLSLVLREPRVAQSLFGGLAASDFVDLRHRAIWAALTRAHEAGQSPVAASLDADLTEPELRRYLDGLLPAPDTSEAEEAPVEDISAAERAESLLGFFEKQRLGAEIDRTRSDPAADDDRLRRMADLKRRLMGQSTTRTAESAAGDAKSPPARPRSVPPSPTGPSKPTKTIVPPDPQPAWDDDDDLDF
ncbi:MAG: DNA primase [Planctomycetes bacterium]|nr:DNA primase [Planctomycetota bacterium]